MLLSKKEDKGQVLVISILLTVFVSAIALSFTSLMITALKTQRDVSNSLIANYAAETGVEKTILKIKNPSTIYPIIESMNFGNGLYYSLRADVNAVDPTQILVESTGIKNNVRRKIEVLIPIAPDTDGVFSPSSWKEVNP
ncbi:hypothetical protein COX95_05035 [bacterium CG_4_10_14_0_2_um_filter_33_32]|nr:MAG: hypothetical protein AUJ93_01705 [bacterium CG2_30_33_46]PIR67645.1 MAG: hypothetical protein COU50_02170 [bacterium CG10_big_fil_rev_8_21_14_0_10_33_18]PIU76629.1 MAG: hypothetical protein COS74_03080 [bacterium CG06_land_8_20_14_3_00_33_50]PIW80848.1 MAG: hypothetical protein COZ97_04460 [bacterium CG_4_8_14_3_um_filter_33_28]PIY85142.1 MAG: hypothetical protein COY76_03755 [bacterium CG_4_10_14_0_8_um_filter_33_57]PIZ85170.1 MAG: hypothetical protein COX95_05035 [bacterium CG_4_10_1